MTDEQIDIAIEQILLNKLKPFDTLKDINAICVETGNTALIFAAASGDILVVQRLLARGVDPAWRNLDGANAFMVSLYHEQEKIAQTLLLYETAQSLNEANYCGNTALAIAANFKWVLLEEAIIKKGGVIAGMHIPPNTMPSQMRAEFLASLQRHGPLSQQGGSASKRMLGHVFVENNEMGVSIDYFDYVFLNSDLKVLTILTDWACQVYRSKIFFMDCQYNDVLCFAHDADGYTHFHTKDIFCFYKGTPSIETISTFFHEAMHLVMDLIYQNDSRPYGRGDSQKENGFEVVLEKTKIRLDNMSPDWMADSLKTAYYSMYSVYTGYFPHQRALELIARIPEILVGVGIDKGMGWLNQFAELMEYYNTIVLPSMKNYIFDNDYLRTDFFRYDNIEVIHTYTPFSPSPFGAVLQAIYQREAGYFIQRKLEAVYKELTVEQLEQIHKVAVFFKGESTFIEQCAEYGRAKRLLKNKQILDRFYLEGHNKKHLQYWSDQVIWPGGCDYKTYRVPHTVFNIFSVLEKETALDGSTEALLEKIHTTRKQSSGSKMTFFRSVIVKQLKTLPDEVFEASFSPGESSHSM